MWDIHVSLQVAAVLFDVNFTLKMLSLLGFCMLSGFVVKQYDVLPVSLAVG
jgi:hypothetical protein